MIRKYEKDLYVIDERELKMFMEAYINLNALECEVLTIGKTTAMH